MLGDLGDGRHLGGRARHEALREARQLVRHDDALDHLDAALAGKADHRLARDAIEEAVGRRRVDLAVLDEEDVGARALRHPAAPVEHERVGIALALGAMLLDGADHVVAGGLCAGRCRRGIRTAVLRDGDAQALQALFHREVAAPVPGRDGEVDLGRLRRHAHLLAAPPGERAHVAVLEVVGLDGVAAGLVDLGDRIGNGEVERLGAVVEALAVLGQLKDLAAVGALALEHGARVMQRVAQHVHVGVPPRHQLAVEPDETVAIVIGGADIGHGCLLGFFEPPPRRIAG